jgi:glutaredoxin
MAVMIDCAVCGNSRSSDTRHCPFCGAAGEIILQHQGPQYSVVNLEKGMPTVDQALVRLDNEIRQARQEHCRVLFLIHGYGSSGRGGVIRQEVRSQLRFMKDQHKINDLLTGEAFSSRTGPGRQILRRFPFLRQHEDLNRSNPGITLVVL